MGGKSVYFFLFLENGGIFSNLASNSFFFQYLQDDVFLLFFCLTMSQKSRKWNVAKSPSVGHIIITQPFTAYRQRKEGETLVYLHGLSAAGEKNFWGVFWICPTAKKNLAKKWCDFQYLISIKISNPTLTLVTVHNDFFRVFRPKIKSRKKWLDF